MKNKGIIVLLVLIIVLGAAAAIYFVMFAPNKETADHRSSYVPGDYFITNVKESENLVKTTIVLVVDKSKEDTEFFEMLTDKNYIIRDAIVMILRSKTYEELCADDVKSVLTEEIVSKVNEALGITNIVTIYFSDYVVN